jgi:hypothetical protein
VIFVKKKGYVISDRGIAHTVLCLSLAVRIIHRPLQTQYFTHILGMARSKGHQTGTQRELRALFTLDTPIPHPTNSLLPGHFYYTIHFLP